MKNSEYTLQVRRNIIKARRDILDIVEDAVNVGLIPSEAKDTVYSEAVKCYLRGYYDAIKQVDEEAAKSKGN